MSPHAVFEILLSFEQHKNWQKAFFDGVPARKVTGHAMPGEEEEEDKTGVCMNHPQSLSPPRTASLSVREDSEDGSGGGSGGCKEGEEEEGT